MQRSPLRTACQFALLAVLVGIVRPAAAQEEAPADEVVPERSFDLEAAQQERLTRFLPNALPKLARRQTVHVVAIGDGVMRYVSQGEHDGDTHRSYAGVFVAELAKLFFYTGGVREMRPYKGQPAKRFESAGPELTIENLALKGRLSLHGIGRVSSDAFANKPSILLIGFGLEDARTSVPIGHYLRAHEQMAAAARERNCDVIFIGPGTLLDANSGLQEMARTRPYAQALEALATRLKVAYFDLGSVTAAGRGLDAEQDDSQFLAAYNLARRDAVHRHTDGAFDPAHPNEAVQGTLGRGLYKALVDGVSPPYRVSGSVLLDAAGGFSTEFKVKNLGAQAVEGRVFLPAFDGFVPEVSSIPFSANAGKGTTLSAKYRSASGSPVYQLDGSEPDLRVPMLIVDGTQASPGCFSAAIRPLAASWTLGSRDDLRSEAAAEFTVHHAAAAGAGRYSITWAGSTSSGSYTAGSPTVFSLKIPETTNRRLLAPLVLELKSGGKTFQFQRSLEVSRNLGLDQIIPMAPLERYRKGRGEESETVRFRASADSDALTLIYEFSTNPRSLGGTPPYQIDFQLDARAYGKRRTTGFVDFVRFSPQPDGSFKVSDLRPAVFGNGYDRKLDKTVLVPNQERLPGGGNRVSIRIPRGFFHLHEWALGNGNSLLGINSSVSMQTANSTAEKPYPEDGSFGLAASGLSRYSPQSLAILELSPRPTSRWSARLY